MAKNLIIVESPTKAKTIGKFLGKNYKIMASVGHLRDLPKSRMGVDVENNFEPEYINVRGKASTINAIKAEAKKVDNVYLASDPDREGEAIAWHLAFLLDLDLKEKNRVVFPEITKETVKEAIKHPRAINLNLVDAQQARRILDRIVGYKLSPILWKKVKNGLSAGRVQSAALKLIIDRENEIRKFIPEEYWSIDFVATHNKIDFTGDFIGEYIDNKIKNIKLTNENDVDNIISKIDKDNFKIIDKDVKEKSRKPYEPFTTSTLQQEASKRIYFSTSKTMSVAQQLYEGINVGEGSVGLISYMRTDSTRLSNGIIDEAISYINENYGKEYASKGRSYNKKKSGSQDAHEAVRVSSIYRTPEKIRDYLTTDQYKLYRLIWERTLASQMKDSKYLSTRYDFESNGILFRANGSIVTFDGFSKVWTIADKKVELPNFEIGDVFSASKINKEKHFTKPKARFTEASLVKELEKNGIGRPSTYSSIIKSLLSRYYVEFEEKSLVPTEIGFTVIELLLQYFKTIINEDFTAEMENSLDKIEESDVEWRKLIKDFYDKFDELLKKAENSSKDFEIKDKPTGEKCPECGEDLLYKKGRNGDFIGCSNFPKCTFTKNIVKELGIVCPKCGGKIIEKISKRGKVFYGCENYPQCDWASWDKPTGEKCAECGDLMVHRKNRKMDAIICNNENCIRNK
ncbi:type I DNA topoisomerase [Helcococcus ovis]|uniref:type I DNA topoisomerase n=1 Tax=Helcococcus ovis TaxID=72026 RepID=UPI00107011A5|nr:type I DNA topoisomerase [Helcococcus ovis]TFF67960.1 type I DNA topoisomerase [Helcococcus ovis]WNZ01914.1 type I DNA topoisomerase [Helcococcus ovis]